MSKKDTSSRVEHVKNVINKSTNTTQAVKDLSSKLFLSERTIWRDYRKG
jgi:hypothetical protein